MRKWSLATAAVTVLAIAACKGNDQQAANDDLSKDLAAAASSDGLAMAPTLHNVQTVVSAEELSPQARVHRAPSARAARPSPHHTPHRDRVTPRPSTEAATVTDPAPSTETEVAATAPQPSAPSDNGENAPSARPHPVDAPSSGGSNGSGAGRSSGHGSGIGIGDIIGAIGGVIIRGGVVDGDHCDPRGGGDYPYPRRGRTYPGGTYPSGGRPYPGGGSYPSGRPYPGGALPLTTSTHVPVLRGGI